MREQPLRAEKVGAASAFAVLPLAAVAGVITGADDAGAPCHALAEAGGRLLPA